MAPIGVCGWDSAAREWVAVDGFDEFNEGR
jgi:hypothetical protein